MFQRLLFDSLHFAKTGKGQQTAQIPWITTDFADLANSPYGNKVPGFQLGLPWTDDFGNTFSLYISNGTLAFGNTCQWATPQATTQNGAGTVTTLTPTAAVTPKTPTDVGNFVYDATLTLDTDRLKQIKGQISPTSIQIALTADTKHANFGSGIVPWTDPDAYSVAPANADALTFIRPWERMVFPLGAATTGQVSGIALSTTADKDWHFEQVTGLAMVNSKGDVTPLVANAPAVPDGVNNGNVKGAAAVAANQVGVCTAAYSAAVGKSSPIWLTIFQYS
jgi:hypothetical protein